MPADYFKLFLLQLACFIQCSYVFEDVFAAKYLGLLISELPSHVRVEGCRTDCFHHFLYPFLIGTVIYCTIIDVGILDEDHLVSGLECEMLARLWL